MTTAAAIGFRAHSGWAAAVAVTGSAHAVAITRRRIEMGDAQPYHAAARLDRAEARELVERCAARAASMAAEALRGLIGDLHRLGHEVTGCGLLLASGRPLPELESILRSHALIHSRRGTLSKCPARRRTPVRLAAGDPERKGCRDRPAHCRHGQGGRTAVGAGSKAGCDGGLAGVMPSLKPRACRDDSPQAGR